MSLILTDKRSTLCFTKDLSQAIEVISLISKPVIVGSYSFIAHPYPGDIDMFEVNEERASVRQAGRRFQRRFQQMAQRIQGRKNTYLTDFKVGEDHHFRIDCDASFEQIREHLKTLFYQQLLTRSEMNEWVQTLQTSRKEFKELVRTRLVLRWTLDEMLKGVKVLPGQRKISLAEALTHQTIVKVDIIALVNGMYTEVTNLFKLSARDPKTNQVNYLSQPDVDYHYSLKQDLKKYSDPVHAKYLKLAKRLWSLSILRDDQRILGKLKPLLESGIARLGQLRALVETLISLFRTVRIPLATAFEQIQRLNFTIGSIPYNILSQSRAEDLCGQIHQLDECRSVSRVISQLEEIYKILDNVVQKQTLKYLKSCKLLKKIRGYIKDE
jgi:hypothetical protein